MPHTEGFLAALYGYRREAENKPAVERSVWINAPRERVWQVVTDPAQIQQWFSPGTEWHTTALAVGGRQYVSNPETNAEMYVQMIEAFDPPRRFVTRSAPEAPEQPHVSTWTLAEEKAGTRLTLTYTGYELDPVEMRHFTLEQNAFGFGMVMQNLQAYVNGKDLPYPGGF